MNRERLRETARIELARRHLLDFTNFTYRQYIAEPAHALIAEALDAVLAGEILRLMIFAPPQHGKSELASVRFPAFWLGKRPNDPIILCSYGASLAYSKSWEARGTVESPLYQWLFPDIGTDRSSRAKDHWRLSGHLGGMVAAGVGGPITGHGAMLGIIDDPFANWEQAQSAVIREKVWDWWRSVFRPRIWEAGAIILIMTRWHEDDLAGRLLQDQAERWMVLRLPALAETQELRDENNKRLGLPQGDPDPLARAPGAALCPQRFSRAALGEIQADVGTMAWAAEYEGVPRAPEGNRFKRAWFPIVDAAPVEARRVRYWDKAGTAGGGAYTAGVLMAHAEGLYYIEDMIRGQWSAHQREQVIRQTAELDGQRYGGPGAVQIWIEQEPGSGGKESAEATIRNLAGFAIQADRPTGNKDVRLEPLAAQAEAGNVRVMRGPWNWDYIEELCSVPSGAYRDQADASAGAFNKLAVIGPPAAGETVDVPIEAYTGRERKKGLWR